MICNLVFNRTLFWVQVHDIPVRLMSKKVVEEICDTIREVHKLTSVVDEEGGNFIQVRIIVNISLPLC